MCLGDDFRLFVALPGFKGFKLGLVCIDQWQSPLSICEAWFTLPSLGGKVSWLTPLISSFGTKGPRDKQIS